MSIEETLDELRAATENNTDAIRGLAEAVKLLTQEKILQPTPTPVPLTAPEPSQNLHGFKNGDRIVLVSNGILRKAVIDVDAYDLRGNDDDYLPVSRNSGEGDGFPWRYCLPDDENTAWLIEALTPKQAPFGVGTPPSDVVPFDWNLAAAEYAIANEKPIVFTYQKPPHPWETPTLDNNGPRLRRIIPFSLDRAGVTPATIAIQGRDLDIDAVRTFRLDRIVGVIQVEED